MFIIDYKLPCTLFSLLSFSFTNRKKEIIINLIEAPSVDANHTFDISE